MEETYQYGYWGIVLIMITIFIWAILKFLRPKKTIEWRNSGILTAFVIALYTEMYGFPLTIYVLSGAFGVDLPFTHTEGHLWSSLFGWGEAGVMIEMAIGYAVIVSGIALIISGWKQIHASKGKLVTGGAYTFVRHPQYTGIMLGTIGMLIHWPTLLTFLLWPILTFAYYRLAKREEKEMEAKFGKAYQEYSQKTPLLIPDWQKLKTFYF